MADITNDDFFDEGNSGIRHGELKVKVDEALTLEAEIAEIEELLASKKTRQNKLLTSELPTLMEEIGTEIYRDPATGQTIELDLAINSSLPKNLEKRNAIMDALRPLGVEQIMSEEYTVAFSPGDVRSAMMRRLLLQEDYDEIVLTNEIVDKVEQLREELGLTNLPAELKTGVNPQTFKKWLKDLILEGRGTEVTEAGIWHGKYAKIKKAKGGKK